MDVPMPPQTRPYQLAGAGSIARTTGHPDILEPCSFVWMTEQRWLRRQKHQEPVFVGLKQVTLYILGKMDMQRFLRNFQATGFQPHSCPGTRPVLENE